MRPAGWLASVLQPCSRLAGSRNRNPSHARLRARAGAGPSLLQLPCFEGSEVLHPTQESAIQVLEPRHLALFEALLELHPAGGTGAQFIHVLAPRVAPPALLSDAPVPGLPRHACCAEVRRVERTPGGALLSVAFAGVRRVQLLAAEQGQCQGQQYPRVAVQWYDDDDEAPTAGVLGGPGRTGEGEPGQGASRAGELERQLAGVLQRVEAMWQALAPGGDARLPAAVRRYAPPQRRRATSYDALRASGHRAATAIDTWRRHGSVYAPAGPKHPTAAADPYQAVGEQLGGEARRRELFSFAAAQVLDMGIPERAALLQTQDTAGRLAYVLAAAAPHLQELAARLAVESALRPGPGAPA